MWCNRKEGEWIEFEDIRVSVIQWIMPGFKYSLRNPQAISPTRPQQHVMTDRHGNIRTNKIKSCGISIFRLHCRNPSLTFKVPNPDQVSLGETKRKSNMCFWFRLTYLWLCWKGLGKKGSCYQNILSRWGKIQKKKVIVYEKGNINQ